jgi:hypothetical protein
VAVAYFQISKKKNMPFLGLYAGYAGFEGNFKAYYVTAFGIANLLLEYIDKMSS